MYSLVGSCLTNCFFKWLVHCFISYCSLIFIPIPVTVHSFLPFSKYRILNLLPSTLPASIKMKPAIILPSLVTLSSAHGFVQQIWLGNNVVDTWNPYKDPFKKGLNKITRKFDNNGPVTDNLFETDAFTCNAAKVEIIYP